MTYDREVVKIPFAELRKIHASLNPDANSNIPLVSVKDADLADPETSYSAMLQEYLDGKNEPAFLERMAQAGAQAGDKYGAAKAAKQYIATLRTPYTRQQLNFVLQNTASINDPGFAILQQQLEASESLINMRAVTIKIINLVYVDVMDPMIAGQQPPDWDAIAAKVKPYGAPAEEILLRARTIDYFNKQKWKDYVPAAKAYLGKYGNTLTDQEKTMFQAAIDQHQ